MCNKRSVSASRWVWLGSLLLAIVASPCAAGTTSYQFDPAESQFVLVGGLLGLNETYTVEGSLGLDIDFGTSVASFVDVDATLNNPSGIRHGESLDSLLNMTSATGTVVDPTHLAFTSTDDQGWPVALDVTLLPSSMTLVGANDAGCCDFFHYAIDAVSVPEPATIVFCLGAVAGLLLCRRLGRKPGTRTTS